MSKPGEDASAECASMCRKHKRFPRALRASELCRASKPGPVEEEMLEKADEEKMVVAIPIFKNVTALDFVGPYEVLHLLPTVKVVFVSHSRDLYAADLGMLSFHSTSTFDETPNPDIVVVPGGGGVQ